MRERFLAVDSWAGLLLAASAVGARAVAGAGADASGLAGAAAGGAAPAARPWAGPTPEGPARGGEDAGGLSILRPSLKRVASGWQLLLRVF